MCLIFVHLLNNDGKGEMMKHLYKPSPINGLHGGRSQDRTVDLLLVRQKRCMILNDLQDNNGKIWELSTLRQYFSPFCEEVLY